MSSAISQATLQAMIGEPDFSRGVGYFRQRRVQAATLSKDRKKAVGEVHGSRRQPYRQQIQLQWTADGRLHQVRGACSCPVGRNCKHVAAVMLALLPELNRHQDENRLQPMSGQGADGHLLGWLATLDELVSTQAPVEAPSQEQLHYVLRGDGIGGLQVDLFRVRRLKSGQLSKSPQRYTPGLTPTPARFLTASDIGILGRLQYLQQRSHAGGTGTRIIARNLPDGTLVGLIREIVGTGRARADSLDAPTLTWREERPVQFEWREQQRGHVQQLVAVGPDGRPVDLLPVIPPVFVDKRDGSCGLALTENEPRLAYALSVMPPVPLQASRKVADVLKRAGTRTPPLPSITVSVRENVKPVPVLKLFGMPGQIEHIGTGHAYAAIVERVSLPVLRLLFSYDGQMVGFEDPSDPEVRDGRNVISIRRNPTFEREAHKILLKATNDMVFEIGPVEADSFSIEDYHRADLMLGSDDGTDDIDEALALDFSRKILPKFERNGWKIEIDDSWPFRFFDGDLVVSAAVAPDREDWFSVSLTGSAGDEELDLLPLVLGVIETFDLDHRSDDGEIDEVLEDLTLFLPLQDGRQAPIAGSQLASLVRVQVASWRPWCVPAWPRMHFSQAFIAAKRLNSNASPMRLRAPACTGRAVKTFLS